MNTLKPTTNAPEVFVGFSKYEKFVRDTAEYRDVIYPLLGLSGEVGEFMELAKKAYRKSGQDWWTVIDRDSAKSELGDIIWYVTRTAQILGIPMDEIITSNVEKLLDRKKNGKETKVSSG